MRAPEPPFPSSGEAMCAYYLTYYPPRFPLHRTPHRRVRRLDAADDVFMYTVDYRSDEPCDAPSVYWDDVPADGESRKEKEESAVRVEEVGDRCSYNSSVQTRPHRRPLPALLVHFAVSIVRKLSSPKLRRAASSSSGMHI